MRTYYTQQAQSFNTFESSFPLTCRTLNVYMDTLLMQTDVKSEHRDPKKRINIILPVELHEEGKRLAAASHRDFSGQIAALIEAAVIRSKSNQGEAA